jgi:hypothetical protein
MLIFKNKLKTSNFFHPLKLFLVFRVRLHVIGLDLYIRISMFCPTDFIQFIQTSIPKRYQLSDKIFPTPERTNSTAGKGFLKLVKLKISKPGCTIRKYRKFTNSVYFCISPRKFAQGALHPQA